MKFPNSSTQNSGLFSGCCRDNGTPFKNGIITICLHKEIVHSSLNYSCWLPFLLNSIQSTQCAGRNLIALVQKNATNALTH